MPSSEKRKNMLLDLFAKTGKGYFLETFKSLRNKSKHMMRGKAEKYKNSQRSRIKDSVSNPKAFWEHIKKLSFTSLTKTSIDAKTWLNYYQNLLNRTPVSVNKSFHRFVKNYIKSHDKNCLLCETGNFEGYDSLMEMNRYINDSEVKTHVDKVKN